MFSSLINNFLKASAFGGLSSYRNPYFSHLKLFTAEKKMVCDSEHLTLIFFLPYFVLQKIEPSAIEDFFGLTTDVQKSSETGYILFYQSRDSAS